LRTAASKFNSSLIPSTAKTQDISTFELSHVTAHEPLGSGNDTTLPNVRYREHVRGVRNYTNVPVVAANDATHIHK